MDDEDDDLTRRNLDTTVLHLGGRDYQASSLIKAAVLLVIALGLAGVGLAWTPAFLFAIIAAGWGIATIISA